MTLIAPELLAMLACPRDGGGLVETGGRLVAKSGRSYPIVDGVPVLLRDDATETIGLAGTSLRLAEAASLGTHDDPLFVDSLGLSDAEKDDVRRGRSGGVDPVVAQLVGATNGILYKDMIGRLGSYPIPATRLPTANGGRLLDVGCSWGRWSVSAARKGWRPVGIDPSLGAVLAARRMADELGTPFLGVVGDARYLPFQPGVFDGVFSYSVLQHLSKSDARMALGETKRVLRADGIVLIQMAAAYGVRSLQHQLMRGFREPIGFEVRYWGPLEVRRAFAEVFGTTTSEVDCYFGLGLQPTDKPLMSPPKRALISTSEALRRVARYLPPLKLVADSRYLKHGF